MSEAIATAGPARPVNPADPAACRDGPPFAELARRRSEHPVTWADELSLPLKAPSRSLERRVGGFWLVTGQAALVEASRNPAVFSSAERGAFLAEPVTRAELERSRSLLIGMDPPEHLRIRRAAVAAFTPAAVRGMRASVARHAGMIVRRLLAAGEFDAVADCASELPTLVLADLLGVPRADRGLFVEWSNNLVGFDDPRFGGGDVVTFRRTFREAFGYGRELARRRRASPRDDLVTRLVTVEVDGSRLSDEEFCSLWLLLVVAGNETTRHLVSGALDVLVERPALRAELAAGTSGIPCLVEELLRWITPIMQFRRTAVADAELAGRLVRAGDAVVLSFLAANRDPAVFADPDGFDPARHLESNFVNAVRTLPLSLAG